MFTINYPLFFLGLTPGLRKTPRSRRPGRTFPEGLNLTGRPQPITLNYPLPTKKPDRKMTEQICFQKPVLHKFVL
jgi:hypothetical protein